MFKNHLKVAFRYLRNHKGYTLVNLLGLTLGFLCFILLNAYVSSEQNFDAQHEQAYRLLEQQTTDQGDIREIAPLGPQVGYQSKEQFPEIEAVAEMVELGRLTVGNDPGSRNYEEMMSIDEGFFEVFDIPFVEGNADGLFAQPNGVILTRSLKEKYFGSQPALGQPLYTNNFEAIVAGVIEDFPPTTHLEASFILPTQTASSLFNWWDDFVGNNWNQNSFVTYFKLRADTDLASLESKITRLAAENWPEEESFNSTYSLQAVQDIHLYAASVEGEINQSKGNVLYIKIFFWIALIILLVACFNYTGLLNVAFMGRSREVGVRKVMGASRNQLLWQFLSESLLLTLVSLGLAVFLLVMARPWLPQFFGASFDLSTLSTSQVLVITGVGLSISLLSIGYPTYLIGKLGIIKALREEHKGRQRVPFRKVMTVFQFVAAIVLIACTTVLYRQINYLQEKELGFDLEGLVVVDINSGPLRGQFEAIKQEFNKLPEVQSVAVSSRVPGEWKNFPQARVLKEGQQLADAQEMIFVASDADLLATYDIELLQGNNFSGTPADSSRVLINQSAVQALGLENPIGQVIEIPEVNWSGDTDPLDEPFRAQIAGVVHDFHFEDFRQSIKPMVIGFWRNPIHRIDYYTLRVSTQDWSNTIASLRRVNDRFDAENPLEYNILNDQFQRFYEADVLRSRLLFLFTGVVIFISCLGLLAMTAFTLRNRVKEIGIRKVLGASATQIIGLIALDFLKLIAIGALVALPISWLLMNRWLKDFAYQIPLQWWLFVGAGVMALLIALVTISIQSIRTALASPVESLRSE